MPSPQLYDQLQETTTYIRNRGGIQPRFGLILGTGLSGLVDQMTETTAIPYEELPHFPVSTVQSHRGQLILGQLAGVPVVALAGRFHYYEGYSMEALTFPTRVLANLGIERLIISNAAGSVNPAFEAGDIVFIRDHINFMGANPLRGHNDERLGPRFPDMLKTYDATVNTTAMALAKELGIRTHTGVYLGLQGPNLETPAEYQMFYRLGADVIGMSTVPEVLVAKHMGVALFVLSVVSNKCYPLEAIKEVSVEEVIAVVEGVTPDVERLVMGLIAQGAF